MSQEVLLIQLASKALAFRVYLTLGNKFLNIQYPFSFPWRNLKIPRSFSKSPRNPQAPSKALWKCREWHWVQGLCSQEDKDFFLLYLHGPSPQMGKEPQLRHNAILAHRKTLQNLICLGFCLFLKQVVFESNATYCQQNLLQLLHPHLHLP